MSTQGDNQLSGKLPDATASWSKLYMMVFSTNRLSGKIPDSTASWSKLLIMLSSTNRLSGKIPDATGSWRSLGLRFVRGLLGTGPPDPTLESTSPSPSEGSIWHRFDTDSTSKYDQIRKSMSNQCRIDGTSMPNRPFRRGGRGGFEGGVRGACA